MDKKAFGSAGDASADWFHYDHATDETIIETVQDVEPILDANKRQFNEAPSHFRGNAAGFTHVARIPEVVVAELQKQGIWNDPARMRKWLADPDNRMFCTHPKAWKL